MTAPKRVQMSRKRPWRADNPHAVVVARPSRWGNPFRVVREPGRVLAEDGQWARHWSVVCDRNVVDPVRHILSADAALATAVDLFQTHLGPIGAFEPDDLGEWLAPLRGRDLACWCPLDGPCHADVLLGWANDEPLLTKGSDC